MCHAVAPTSVTRARFHFLFSCCCVKNPIELHSIFSSCFSWFCALRNKYSMRSPSVLGITEFFRNSYLMWSVNPGLSWLARRNFRYKESTCFWRRLRTISHRGQPVLQLSQVKGFNSSTLSAIFVCAKAPALIVNPLTGSIFRIGRWDQTSTRRSSEQTTRKNTAFPTRKHL